MGHCVSLASLSYVVLASSDVHRPEYQQGLRTKTERWFGVESFVCPYSGTVVYCVQGRGCAQCSGGHISLKNLFGNL